MLGLERFRHLDNFLWYQSGLGRFFWSMMPWSPAPGWPPPFPNVACAGCEELLAREGSELSLRFTWNTFACFCHRTHLARLHALRHPTVQIQPS